MQLQFLKSFLKKITKKTGTPLLIVTAFFHTLSITGCKYGLHELIYRENPVDVRASKLTEVTLPREVTDSAIYQSGTYNFMIISDMHYGGGYEVPEKYILKWLNDFDRTEETIKQKPLFCLILGDMTENGYREDFAAFNTFQGKLQAMGIPVYCVMGNHDLPNNGWQYWSENCSPGTSFFRFKTNSLSWYFTDTANGTLGSVQFNLLKDAMAADSNKKLVFSHYPLHAEDGGILLFSEGNEKEIARTLDLYARTNVQYTFEGHWHSGSKYDFGSFKEFISQTLKKGVWNLVSVDETAGNTGNPIKSIKTVSVDDF